MIGVFGLHQCSFYQIIASSSFISHFWICCRPEIQILSCSLDWIKACERIISNKSLVQKTWLRLVCLWNVSWLASVIFILGYITRVSIFLKQSLHASRSGCGDISELVCSCLCFVGNINFHYLYMRRHIVNT